MARVLSVLLLVTAAAICAYAQTTPEQGQHLSLTIDWDKTIRGPIAQEALVQACVDRDKNLQVIMSARPPFATSAGLWITLDRNGRVLEETTEPALETPSNVSIWCAQNGQIVIGISSQRAALRYSSSHQLLSREVLPQNVRGVFTDETGALIVARFAGPALRRDFPWNAHA
jgi:hypothetical protein